MAYDIAIPLAINSESNKIKEHSKILANEVINNIEIAYQYGIIHEELSFQELCQLASVLLYGGDNTVSDKVFEIGCDVYEHISKFEKR